MEDVGISETSVYVNEIIRRYIPQSCHLHTRSRANLKFKMQNLGLRYSKWRLVEFYAHSYFVSAVWTEHNACGRAFVRHLYNPQRFKQKKVQCVATQGRAVGLFLSCTVLCKHRPWDRKIAHPIYPIQQMSRVLLVNYEQNKQDGLIRTIWSIVMSSMCSSWTI
jgi:hypothetical protein